MAEENVEIVQAIFDAWNAGDMDGVRELLDEDVVLRNPEGWPEPGPFVGRNAVMAQWAQARIWDRDELVPTSEPVPSGDRVVVRATWRGEGGQVPDSELTFTLVWTVLEGRIHAVDYFWDHAEALEAAGVPG